MRWNKQGNKNQDKWIIKISIFCVLLLIFIQIMLCLQGPRYYMSRIDRLEGETIDLDKPNDMYSGELLQSVWTPFKLLRKNKQMTICMIKPQRNHDIFITINGSKVADFASGEVKLSVFDGDYVEIDASAFLSPQEFVVHVSDQEFINPVNGMIFTSKGNIVSLGKIKIKS